MKQNPVRLFILVTLAFSIAGVCKKDNEDVLAVEGKGKISFGTKTYIMHTASAQTGPGGHDYQLTVEETLQDGSRVGMVFRFDHKPVPGETYTIKDHGILGTDLSPVDWYRVYNNGFESRRFGTAGETMTVKSLTAGGFVVYFNNLTPISSNGTPLSGDKASGYFSE
jgi:hypothetical protein